MFTAGGTEYRLAALKEDDDPGLFVIFKDQTAGKSTYPSGRFINTPRGSRRHHRGRAFDQMVGGPFNSPNQLPSGAYRKNLLRGSAASWPQSAQAFVEEPS